MTDTDTETCRLPFLALREFTPSERVALATAWFFAGECLTAATLAELLDMTPRGARDMLNRLSRVIPLVRENGGWRLMPK